ncbi:MAG: MFS transporter [Anaerolineae bacterium]
MPIFLVRLGASHLILGLVSSLPAVAGMLLAVPAGQLLARSRNIVRLVSVARALCYFSFALIGLVPFLMTRFQPEIVVTVWAISAVPQVLVFVGITAIIGMTAGPDGRFLLLSRRWSLMGLVTTGTILIAGQALRLLAFPLNYQVMFLLSAFGAAGTYMATIPIELSMAPPPVQQPSLLALLRRHALTLRGNRDFVNLAASHMVLRLGMSLALPLLPIYWVRNLHASDAAVSFINGAAVLASIVGYFVWTRSSQRRGPRWVLLFSSLGVSLYPLLTGLTQQVGLLALWAIVAGFFVAGQDLALIDLLFIHCPPNEQPVYVGFYQATSQLANAIAPLAGTALAGAIGIVPALIASSALRLVGLGLMARLVHSSSNRVECSPHEVV